MQKKTRHVLRLLRDTLDLSQQETAGLLGASESTVRAIEGGRLPLSPKFAHRLSAQTGIRAKWFLENRLEGPLPDPIEVRRWFSEAQEGLPPVAGRSEYVEGNFPDGYLATLIPMSVLLRFLILQRLIARELGYSGCRHTGFFHLVTKMNLQLLGRVPNPKTRRRLLQESKDIVSQGMEKVARVIMSDCQEIMSAVRENKINNTKSPRKPPIRLSPANSSVAKALRKVATRSR